MASNVAGRILESIHEHYREHGDMPRRVTVSQTVARELDAEIASKNENFTSLADIGNKNPSLLSLGAATWIRAVLVVADLDDKHIVDIR